jgi:hypothetical protein
MTVPSDNNSTDNEISLLPLSSVPTENKLTDKELSLQILPLLFPLSSALSESAWLLKSQSPLPQFSSQNQTDCNDDNLVLSERDDGLKEGLSEACLAYKLMIDAISVRVPMGEEMPAADRGGC